jgi:Helix-turn-helix domain
MPATSAGMTECGAALLRNRAGNFSVGRLMEFLNRLGQDVRITVKPTRKRVEEIVVGSALNALVRALLA